MHCHSFVTNISLSSKHNRKLTRAAFVVRKFLYYPSTFSHAIQLTSWLFWCLVHILNTISWCRNWINISATEKNLVEIRITWIQKANCYRHGCAHNCLCRIDWHNTFFIRLLLLTKRKKNLQMWWPNEGWFIVEYSDRLNI